MSQTEASQSQIDHADQMQMSKNIPATGKQNNINITLQNSNQNDIEGKATKRNRRAVRCGGRARVRAGCFVDIVI